MRLKVTKKKPSIQESEKVSSIAPELYSCLLSSIDLESPQSESELTLQRPRALKTYGNSLKRKEQPKTQLDSDDDNAHPKKRKLLVNNTRSSKSNASTSSKKPKQYSIVDQPRGKGNPIVEPSNGERLKQLDMDDDESEEEVELSDEE